MVVMEDAVQAQRLEALEHANEVRARRAQLKREVSAQRVLALLIVADPPAWAESMSVQDLLLAMPKVGRVKAAKLLKVAGVSPTAMLGAISPQRRASLLDQLRGVR